MSDTNVWVGIGHLGQDVQAPQNNGPARFSVAINRRVKKGEEWAEEPSWIDIVYWHKSILPYLTKGKQIGITGELCQEKWTDKESGQPRSKLVVVAQDIQLLGESRKDGPGSTQSYSGASSAAQPSQSQPRGQPAQKAAVSQGEFTDDIPF